LFLGGALIFLMTDFGSNDIYVGQVKATLYQHNPTAKVIDLLHDVPNFDAESGAHLLAALAGKCLPEGSVMLAVVDAGVGGQRRPIVVQADGRWFVGPDNGLLSVLAARAASCRQYAIVWQPQGLSNSFHGRDLFAPVAALLVQQKLPQDWLEPLPELAVTFGSADLLQVVYVDHYGNAVTGLRASQISQHDELEVGGKVLRYARTFCESPLGQAFWFENSIGLVEVALNCGSAAQQLDLAVGTKVRFIRA
jgi:S-adenosylmethionine hydrolase